MMSPTQKVHLHDTTDMKPEMMGASCGPLAVAYTSQPTCVDGCIAATHRHEEGHGAATSNGIVVDVCKQSADNGDGARCCNAAQQSDDQEEGPIGRNSTRHGEDGEEDKRPNHDDSTSVALAQRGEDYGSEDIADKEEGYG